MGCLKYFIFSLVATAFVVWMDWGDLIHGNIIEGGRILGAYMLIGGGCFVAYQFARAFGKE